MSRFDSGMASRSPVIPYGGTFGGFMPYRMGGASLSFQARSSSAMGSNRTSFSLAPTTAGMSAMSGSRPRTAFGLSGAMGTGDAMAPRGPLGRTTMGVMPPSFAYPFYQPPGWLVPASSGTGMSM
jgi:hypothetical protein